MKYFNRRINRRKQDSSANSLRWLERNVPNVIDDYADALGDRVSAIVRAFRNEDWVMLSKEFSKAEAEFRRRSSDMSSLHKFEHASGMVRRHAGIVHYYSM